VVRRAAHPEFSMNRDLARCALLAGMVLVCGCTPRASLYADDAPVELHNVKVFAGDRLEIDHQAITLANAETPQPAPRAGCRAETVAAAHVSEVVRALLTGARHIEIRAPSTGGDLKRVSVDGADLGQTLIDQDLAVARLQKPMAWCGRAVVEAAWPGDPH
jgi:hypothetical protein